MKRKKYTIQCYTKGGYTQAETSWLIIAQLYHVLCPNSLVRIVRNY